MPPHQRSVGDLAERVYLIVIAVAALFVSYLGYVAPERMDRAFTWAVIPPLHARFIASLYLFGGVYVLLCALLRRRAVDGPVLGGIVVFTSLLLLVTVLNPDAFDFDLSPVWVWTLSYAIYPVLGVMLLLRRRSIGEPVVEAGEEMPAAMGVAMSAIAGVMALTGGLLLFAREVMVDAWPWKVSNGLAQTYAAPLLAIALCAWRYSTRTRWSSMAAIGPALFALGVGVVASSIRHRAVLGPTGLREVLWYAAWFGVVAVGAAATVGGLLHRVVRPSVSSVVASQP